MTASAAARQAVALIWEHPDRFWDDVVQAADQVNPVHAWVQFVDWARNPFNW